MAAYLIVHRSEITDPDHLKAYADGLSHAEEAALTDALARNLLNGQAPAFALQLAKYARAAAAAQAAAPVEALLDADGWPPLAS